MKRAKWSAPPGLGPGAGILARLVRARPSGGGQACHSQQMDIQVSHRPLFESYQICHRKPSHSSSRVTPVRVILSLIAVSLISPPPPTSSTLWD